MSAEKWLKSTVLQNELGEAGRGVRRELTNPWVKVTESVIGVLKEAEHTLFRDHFILLIFKTLIFTYLAALGVAHGLFDLHCGIQGL